MKASYTDILSRISEQPKWWDEQGTPRYCDFNPKALTNMYARACALLLIRCQFCHHEFTVAMEVDEKTKEDLNLWRAEQAKANAQTDDGPDTPPTCGFLIHYGDPPNIGCCPGGPMANCDDLNVLEFWVYEKWDWQRLTPLEGPLPDALLEE